MSRRTQENIVALLLLAGFLGIIWLSLGYSPRSRMVPLPMAVLGAALVVVQLAWQNFRRVDDLTIDTLDLVGSGGAQGERAVAAAMKASEEEEMPAPGGSTLSRQLYAFGLVGIMLAMFLLLGPILSGFLFTAGYLIVGRHYSPLFSVLFAGGITAFVVIVFGFLLEVQLDRALLLPGLPHLLGL